MLEQLPGLVVQHDLTSHLETEGYFASYNIPVFPRIYNDSGFQALYDKTKDEEYSHSGCARATLFAKVQGSIRNIEGIQKVMRYNDWKNDIESKNDPGLAIAARKDLAMGDDFELDGAIDAKVRFT